MSLHFTPEDPEMPFDSGGDYATPAGVSRRAEFVRDTIEFGAALSWGGALLALYLAGAVFHEGKVEDVFSIVVSLIGTILVLFVALVGGERCATRCRRELPLLAMLAQDLVSFDQPHVEIYIGPGGAPRGVGGMSGAGVIARIRPHSPLTKAFRVVVDDLRAQSAGKIGRYLVREHRAETTETRPVDKSYAIRGYERCQTLEARHIIAGETHQVRWSSLVHLGRLRRQLWVNGVTTFGLPQPGGWILPLFPYPSFSGWHPPEV